MYRNSNHVFLDQTYSGHDDQIRATVHAYGYGNTLQRPIYQENTVYTHQGATLHRPGYQGKLPYLPGYQGQAVPLAGHHVSPLHSPGHHANNLYADLNILRQENTQRSQVSDT